MSGPPARRSALLAIDTATRHAVVAVGGGDGTLLGAETWAAGHVHGERLLASVLAALGQAGLEVGDVAAVIVGTGPGAFTGMRVGLATAKGLAFGLGVPIVGVPTVVALAAAVPVAPGSTVAVVQPAGPSGRYVTVLRRAEDGAEIVDGPAFVDPDDVAVPTVAWMIALDLPSAPDEASEAGRLAVAALPATLLRLGGGRLVDPGPDDAALLAPAYVTMPRGIAAVVEGVTWSPAPR